jgi:CHASE3 domain sensor protein
MSTAPVDVLSLIFDAETVQRGYLITGKEHYLEPYGEARSHVTAAIADMRRRITCSQRMIRA